MDPENLYMLGAVGSDIDDDVWQMGAPQPDQRYFRRPPQRRRGANPHNRIVTPITFADFAFVAGNSTTTLEQVATPEVPFAGNQMIATVIRNGTTAGLAIPRLAQFFVGATQMILTSPGPSLDNYSRDAANNHFRLPPTGLGQRYRAQVQLSAALTGTDTLTVSIQLNGQARMNPGYVVPSW